MILIAKFYSRPCQNYKNYNKLGGQGRGFNQDKDNLNLIELSGLCKDFSLQCFFLFFLFYFIYLSIVPLETQYQQKNVHEKLSWSSNLISRVS